MSESKSAEKKGGKKLAALLISLVLLTLAAGVTTAFILDMTKPVKNTFKPSGVSCEVTEDFDGTVKKNVNVKNTGDAPAYIRVKLITYRVNDQQQMIGGTAEIPDFTCGEGWFKKDGFYYYSKAVPAGESPASDLIGNDGVLLEQYTDADGGRQVIEVMAEAIQSEPPAAVEERWNVTANADGTIS